MSELRTKARALIARYVWGLLEETPGTRGALREERCRCEHDRAEFRVVGPTIEDKVLAITACLTYAISESNVYWQRNAIYFTLNSILFGAVLAFPGQFDGVILPLVGAAGTAFNWHWPHVNRYSKTFAERWREDARTIASSDPFLEEHLAALLKRSRIVGPKGPKPSVVMNNMAAAFRVIWLVVIVVGIWFVLFGTGDKPDQDGKVLRSGPAQIEQNDGVTQDTPQLDSRPEVPDGSIEPQGQRSRVTGSRALSRRQTRRIATERLHW